MEVDEFNEAMRGFYDLLERIWESADETRRSVQKIEALMRERT